MSVFGGDSGQRARVIRMPRSWRMLAVGALALVSLGGCDWSGMHPMMGRRSVPASFRSNGERIYFTGTGASSRPITFQGGDMRVRMHGGGCTACHGEDRRGGTRMMPWFSVVAPSITPETLFGDHDEGQRHGEHGAYTDPGLRRAITEGIDPAGKRLDPAMPRWSMGREDLDDLIRYLRGERDRHAALLQAGLGRHARAALR